MNTKKLIIIAGASRGIGKAFLDQYKKLKDVIPYGINRTGAAGEKLDLMDVNASYKFVKNLDLKDVSRIVYMHAIGIDKFEPQGRPHIDFDGDGIDDEVLSSNYSAFIHLAEPLIDIVKTTKIPMTICNIGSISDIFQVPYWQSFSRAKNMVRQFGKSINETGINSLVLNVSSTLDEDGNTYGRKNIETTYWQTTNELIEKSFRVLDDFYKVSSNYAEFDFFKFNPSFRRDYFTNLPELYATWQRDLGFVGKEIPLGIRI
jgi:short-subunit dehydrogenase